MADDLHYRQQQLQHYRLPWWRQTAEAWQIRITAARMTVTAPSDTAVAIVVVVAVVRSSAALKQRKKHESFV